MKLKFKMISTILLACFLLVFQLSFYPRTDSEVSAGSTYGMVTTNKTSTPTVKPKATATPKPKVTATPKPKVTATPKPKATATPKPKATATPKPKATATPKPKATATPKPTPKPTAKPTLKPTATPIPKPVPIQEPSTKIVGYYAAWAAYSGFTPDKVDASKLTHINYSFANIGSDLKITLGYPDIDPANIKKLNALKVKNPNLRTIIAVGGWTWSNRFSDVALTEKSRTAFANSCIEFIKKYNFDGIDIDWEYPVSGGISTNKRRPEDKQNFTLLLKTLREKLDEQGKIDGKKYVLSFAGAAGAWYVNNIELSKISQYVDYANIMTYDLHGTWEALTDFNAPLYNYGTSTLSVASSVDVWLKQGFPKEKLIMGVPFYGHIYRGVPNINQGLFQSFTGGQSISYAKLAANYLNSSEYMKFYNETARVPWLFNGSTFISYENEKSMNEKAKYIKAKGLGGVMIWELSQDPNRVLLNALYKGLN